MSLLDKKIVFFTGKGGVGKSLISLAFAADASQRGKRVLWVELGGSYFSEYLIGKKLQFTPQKPFSRWQNLELSHWTGVECLEDYVGQILKIKSLVSVFLGHPAMRAFINAAPALSDVSILGKLTSGCRNVKPSLDYDMVVLDSYSTGHFLSMLRAPRGLAEAVRVGPMGSQSREIDEVLQNTKDVGFGLVTLPEELPVEEVLELQEKLKKEWKASPTIFCNRILPETNVIESDSSQFLQFLNEKNERQDRSINQLMNTDCEKVLLPMIYEKTSVSLVGKMAEKLGEQQDD